MPGFTGKRSYWPAAANVNIQNGNLHIELGSGSCVTCGGGSASAFPSPQSTTLNGPTLIFDSMMSISTDLGSFWRLPFFASIDFSGDPVIIYDADGTQREYDQASGTLWTSTIERDDKVTLSGGDYILERYNGDKWYFHGSGASSGKLKKITSRTTHEITITRDGNGRITTITDGQGRETKLFYVTTGGQTRLSEYREPAPGDVGYQSTFFTYDSSARLIGITNPLGETTKFEYDGSGRLSKSFDGHGHATEYTYDGSNRITNVKDPANSNTAIAYTNSTTRTVTNKISKVTTYVFDASDRISKITDALSNETEFEYDATSWELTALYGPKIPFSGTPWSRHKTVLTYGTGDDTHELAKKEIKKITNTDSTGTLLAKEEWTYNTQHDVLTHKNPLDKITTYTYKLDGGSNSVGLVATIVNALSQTIATNTYDTEANKYRITKTKNGVNKETLFAYSQNTANSYGTPDKITLPSGSITNFKVDVRGRKYEMTDPTGNPVKYDFDSLDRLIRTTFPDGTTTGTIYDCCHQVADYDQNGFGSSYEFDVMGNLTKVTDQNGEATEFTYNAEGWQLTVTDPRGKVTTTTYDDIGRATQVEYPGSWKEIFTYFEPGMVKTKKNEKGVDSTTVTYEYDDLYRLKKKDFPSGTDTEFETDAAGRLTKMKDASGEKRYTYDDADRLTKILQGPQGFVDGTDQNYKIEYTWNAASQKTETKLTVRTLSAKTWTYTYTDVGQLNILTNPDSEATWHEYLTDNRLKKIILRKSIGSTGPTREFFYQDTSDAHAYVASKPKFLRKVLDKTSGGSTISSATYELDKAGRQLAMANQDSEYWNYGMDPNSQTRAENMWASKGSSTRNYQLLYSFDANGNRLTQFNDGTLTNYTYGDSNQILTAGSDTFTFDHFLNMKTKVSGGNTTTYNWDSESNLLNIDYPGTSNDDTHEFDGAGRRMRSKLNGAANWTHFVWDEVAGTLLAEYTFISSTFALTSENSWGHGLYSTNRASTKRYFHFSGTGNTIALTDTSEGVTDTYGYTSSGTAVSSLDSGTSVNPFRWMGMGGAYDDGAMGSIGGLVSLHSLNYDPIIARQLQGQEHLTQEQRCSLEKYLCERRAEDAYDDCIDAANAFQWGLSTACLLLGEAGPIVVGLCLSAAVAAGDKMRSNCKDELDNANDACNEEYIRCLRPPGPPSLYNLCMGHCFFECALNNKSNLQECYDRCRGMCLSLIIVIGDIKIGT